MLLAGCRTGCGKLTTESSQAISVLARRFFRIREYHVAIAVAFFSSSCHLQG